MRNKSFRWRCLLLASLMLLDLSCKKSVSSLASLASPVDVQGSQTFHVPAEGRIYVYHYFSPYLDRDGSYSLDKAKAFLQNKLLDARADPGRAIGQTLQYGLGLYAAADPISSSSYGGRMLLIPLRPGTDILQMDVAGIDAPDSSIARKAIRSAAGIISYPWQGLVEAPSISGQPNPHNRNAFVLRNVEDILWDEVRMYSGQRYIKVDVNLNPSIGSDHSLANLDAALTKLLAADGSEITSLKDDMFLNSAWKPIGASDLDVLAEAFRQHNTAKAIYKCCSSHYDPSSYGYGASGLAIENYLTAPDREAYVREQPPAKAVAEARELELIQPGDAVTTIGDLAAAMYHTVQTKHPELLAPARETIALFNEVMTRVNEHAVTALIEGPASQAEKAAGAAPVRDDSRDMDTNSRDAQDGPDGAPAKASEATRSHAPADHPAGR